MKSLTYLSLTLSLTVALQSVAQACSTVRTLNATDSSSSVIISLNAAGGQADVESFELAAGANRSDILTLGPRGETGLSLNADVSNGTQTATCSISMSQCTSMALMIGLVPQTNCTVPPEVETCKHDNGNHWGEYRKLGMTDVPPHSGKPNATKPCKSKSGKPSRTVPQECPAVLSCTFAMDMR